MTALSRKGRNIVDVAAGKNITACLSDAGEVILWGKGIMTGRALGGDLQTQPEEKLSGLEGIGLVSCGRKHVLAVSGLPELNG